MKKTILTAAAALLACPLFVSGASAQTAAPKPVTLSGSAALVSDYRFRGVSQSDNHAAIQAGLIATHTSGFYAGFWGSNLAGWGQFGGANLELDLIGGFKKTLGSVTVDAGLTWYMYPAGADTTDFAEPYVKLSTTLGPINALAGVAYAPKQRALGNVSNTPKSRFGASNDNLYIWGDASAAVPGTGFTAKAHVGYSKGNPGLGPNGTSVTPTGSYWDWLGGVDYTFAPMTVGVAYVGTSITRRGSAYLLPNFATTKGGSISSGRIVGSISASF